MKKTAKLLAIVLAVVMALSVLPFAAFAATEDEDKVAAWNENYELLLDEVLDNSNYTSWQYVDVNQKAINDKMAVYTAFALYDNAWTNYASQSINVDNAEKILLALIEKADYSFDDGYVDEIVSVLETATDVNDFIQKVNQYTNIELFASSGWGTAFEVIGDVAKIGNAYQTYRDEFIEAYARVLSVQMANAYYVDMLNYIVEKNSYSVLTTAAQNLIDDINESVEDAIEKIVASAAEDGANIGVEYLAKLALNSNAYTAVALKVYQIGTSVADFLWNTGDQYALIDTVKTSYYYQADIAEWTVAALEEDAEKAEIAVNFIIAARKASEQALYNLKIAETDGAVNKIKNKLYGTVYNDIEVSIATLDAIEDILFNTEVADMKPIVRVVTAYCPVNVEILKNNDVLFTLYDGTDNLLIKNEYGVFATAYSEYADTYHKVAFLYDTYRVRLVGVGDGYVTVVMDALKDGAVEDWSFTDRLVANGTKIVFDTDYAGTPYYVASDANAVTYFNDEFIASEQPEVTAEEVVEATKEVVKEESKSFFDLIKEFFANFFENLFKVFKK